MGYKLWNFFEDNKVSDELGYYLQFAALSFSSHEVDAIQTEAELEKELGSKALVPFARKMLKLAKKERKDLQDVWDGNGDPREYGWSAQTLVVLDSSLKLVGGIIHFTDDRGTDDYDDDTELYYYYDVNLKKLGDYESYH